MRTALTTAILILLASAALADEVDDARRQAVAGRDSYWKCLGQEYKRVSGTNMSGQDFAVDIGGICASERQNFRVSLVDYLTQKFPEVDAGDHLASANNAIDLAQRDVVASYVKASVDRK